MNEEFYLEKFIQTEAENERLRNALILALVEIQHIRGSRKGSIGSIDNVYLPQLNCEHINTLENQLQAALK